MRSPSKDTAPPRHAGLAAFCLFGTLAIGALLATPLSAQTYNGRPIVEVRFEGQTTLSDQTLRFYLGLEEGVSHTSATLNEKLHLLWSRNLLDDIRITTEDVEGGVRLIVNLRERPTLASVQYQGLKRIPKTEVNDRITRDGIKTREGDPLSEGELYRLKAAIEDLYHERGFRLAEASYVIDTDVNGDKRAIFTVDEGDKVRISEVDFGLPRTSPPRRRRAGGAWL